MKINFHFVRAKTLYEALASYNRPSPSAALLREWQNLRTIIVIADIHRGLHKRASSTIGTIFARMVLNTPHAWPSGIGQVSPPIHPLTSSQGAVFLVNSCQEYFRCGPSCEGQALSRSYGRFFAEFLEKQSLVRLGLLDLNTGVGLRYGSYIARV